MRWTLVMLSIFLIDSCHRPSAQRADPAPTASPSAPTAPAEPIRIDELAIVGDLPAYVLRGNSMHTARFVFLGGMCSHPLGYAQSFAHAAANRGDLVALQGDVSCGGPLRKWSYDVVALEKRIDAAFEAAGLEPHDVTLVGYSQGAVLAERLAAHSPAKFTRVILMAGPLVPSPRSLARVEGAVMMGGTLDGQTAHMRDGYRALAKAHIPSTFLSIPGAPHGQLGATPNLTMADAFAWLEQNARAPVTPVGLGR